MTEDTERVDAEKTAPDLVPWKWWQDPMGKQSSKRLNGTAAIIGGLAIAGYAVMKDPQLVTTVLWPVLSAGTVLLGAGVLERGKK